MIVRDIYSYYLKKKILKLISNDKKFIIYH